MILDSYCNLCLTLGNRMDNPDIQKLIAGIKALLSLMFGGQPPAWLLPLIAWFRPFSLFLSALVVVLVRLRQLWSDFLRPIFYNPNERLRRLRRQRFAEHIEGEIKRLNQQEAWQDYRFTELR